MEEKFNDEAVEVINKLSEADEVRRVYGAAFEPNANIVIKACDLNDFGTVQWSEGQEVVATGKRVLPPIQDFMTKGDFEGVKEFVTKWTEHLASQEKAEETVIKEASNEPLKKIIMCYINESQNPKAFKEANAAIWARLPKDTAVIFSTTRGDTRLELQAI